VSKKRKGLFTIHKTMDCFGGKYKGNNNTQNFPPRNDKKRKALNVLTTYRPIDSLNIGLSDLF